MEELTLRQLHEELGLKQNITRYVENTNKKYQFLNKVEADTPLATAIYMMIRTNTLGKIRNHAQQYAEIKNELKKDNQIVALKEENRLLREKASKAENIVSKDNLKNAYIECLKITGYDSSYETYKKLSNYLNEKGVKYAEFLNDEGIQKAYEDRIEWFENELNK